MWHITGLTLTALLALAGNSVLARLALSDGAIDPAGFTLLRLASGTAILVLILVLRKPKRPSEPTQGSWFAALALFAYALTFSYAYLSLHTGTGALILFGFVQLTMIASGLFKRQPMTVSEWLGTLLAFAGLIYLMLPGAESPSLNGFVLMAVAGIAWGLYTLKGRGSTDASRDTAWNFIRTLPLVALTAAITASTFRWTPFGLTMAVLSGSLTSGLGYVLWYQCLRHLSRVQAGVLQLAVPLIAAFGGIVFAGERLTQTFVTATLLVLGGIALVTITPSVRKKTAN